MYETTEKIMQTKKSLDVRNVSLLMVSEGWGTSDQPVVWKESLEGDELEFW